MEAWKGNVLARSGAKKIRIHPARADLFPHY